MRSCARASRWSVWATIAVVGATWTSQASAQSEVGARHRLAYSVPDGFGCTSEENFASGIEARLGRALFDTGATASVEVTVTRDEEQWTLLLRVVDKEGEVSTERAMVTKGGTCEAVVSGAALALELLLEEPRNSAGEAELPENADVEVAESTEPDDPETEGTTGRDADLDPVTMQPDPERPTSHAERWELSAGGAVYANVVQEFALGWGAGFGYTLDMGVGVRVAVGQTQTVTTSHSVDDVPVELSMSLKHVGLSVSYAWYRDQEQLHQVGMEAHYGSLGVALSGARPVGDGEVAWGAVGVRAASRVRIAGPLLLAGSAQVLTPLLDDEFTEVGGTVLHRLAPVGGLVVLGIGASW